MGLPVLVVFRLEHEAVLGVVDIQGEVGELFACQRDVESPAFLARSRFVHEVVERHGEEQAVVEDF